MAAQDRENLPEYDTVTVFTPEEIERFKSEAFRCYSNGNRVYQQSAAYILMLNTGLRTVRIARIAEQRHRLGTPSHAPESRREGGCQARRSDRRTRQGSQDRQAEKRVKQARCSSE